MPTPDEQIGSNLIKLRGSMTQRELAEKMKQRGWKWTHVTVGSIERGERPLRLAEAEAVVDAIGHGFVHNLLASEADATVQVWMRKMWEANAAVEKAVRTYVETQLQLSMAAYSAQPHPDSTTGEGILDWLSHSPQRAVETTLERIWSEDAMEASLAERLYGETDGEDRGIDISDDTYIKAFYSWQRHGEHPEAP
ncbi:hypothetical protein C1I63_13890 [Rathayibacter caricis DSM 15933]|uniref:HTH cro/C1-type domain-containing protein n=1 Tax=Rathayibacter caricis DSM 15933 TaxID=1328867 RepID=A0A2T4UWC0_9MICO|nr:helix-turn-helix transcriptional regulator [Rathayibacter caricis]PTL73821.1 hypothetical protein C1I63_13890 [Rathayibacter caricis DSM 15933]